MQECYSHCVPKDHDNSDAKCVDKSNKSENFRRVCVVFRTGQQKYFERDTGEACSDLSPRKPIIYRYGHIASLKEGSTYTRRELQRMGAFQVTTSCAQLLALIVVCMPPKKKINMDVIYDHSIVFK